MYELIYTILLDYFDDHINMALVEELSQTITDQINAKYTVTPHSQSLNG